MPNLIYWTQPRYAVARLKLWTFEMKNPGLPWLTQDSIRLMGQLIRPTDVGMEFGSGRSTIWLAARCSHLESIEHNERWYKFLQEQISNSSNVVYQFKSIETGSDGKSDYLSPLEQRDSESLDFILNDGKKRDLVFELAISRLKKGGLLILDNAERYFPNPFKVPESIGNDVRAVSLSWQPLVHEVRSWRKIWTTNGVTCTLLLFKS